MVFNIILFNYSSLLKHGMLTIGNIAYMRKPTVFILQDMCGLCGAEHYITDHCWHYVHRDDNIPEHESGFDLYRYPASLSDNISMRALHDIC